MQKYIVLLVIYCKDINNLIIVGCTFLLEDYHITLIVVAQFLGVVYFQASLKYISPLHLYICK